MSLTLCSLVCLLAALRASGQTTTPHALFRMERLQPGQAVCALVDESGAYRVEKLFRSKSEMYVGTLDAVRVEQLRAILANEVLRKVSQDNVRSPLLTDTLDRIQLAIWRERGWQELMFTSPDSRKAYKESFDPLLHWFQDLQKEHPQANRVEGPATRCLPPKEAQLAAKTEASEVTRPTLPLNHPPLYLFDLHSRHFYNGTVDSSCTIVFTDGSYHTERGSQNAGSDRRDRIAEGHLDAEAIQELNGILDSPNIKDLPEVHEEKEARFSVETSSTMLRVPRDNKTQVLIFADRFNTVGSANGIGDKSNMNYGVTDDKILDPIRHWLKLITDFHDQAWTKGAAGNNCAAVPTATADNRTSR
jgi:hypothetical protein